MTAASGALGTGRSTGGPAKAATLAMVWAYACATAIKGTKSIKTRSHGHRCKSRFRLGFDQLRKWICRDLGFGQRAKSPSKSQESCSVDYPTSHALSTCAIAVFEPVSSNLSLSFSASIRTLPPLIRDFAKLTIS